MTIRSHLNQTENFITSKIVLCNKITVDTIFTHVLHTHTVHIYDFLTINNFFTASRYFFDYVLMIKNTPDNISAHTHTISLPS